jgi:Ca2+-binding RTX toxin-like protein
VSVSRRGLAALATTAAAVSVGTLTATPAYAAGVHGTAKVSGTTVSFVAAAGKANLIFITRSGRTVTIDNRSGWGIKAGAGCKAVSGDKTKVKCTTKKTPKLVKVAFGAKDDYIYNQTSLILVATGGAGSDHLQSMGAADRLYGGDGDDFLMGGNGANQLFGGAGADALFGGSGVDRMYGGPGNDGFRGLGGNDIMSDEAGQNTFDGGAGADTLYGGDGTDSMRGGDGNDTIYGRDGTDYLFGGKGNDRLYSSPSSAESFRERIDGGSGLDICTTVKTLIDCETLV